MVHNVYVVDDDALARDSLCDMIGMIPGVDVHGYGSGDLFLADLPEGGGVLLLDIFMPGFSGLETLRRLDSDLNRFPTIMMSGSAEVRDAVDALKLGAFDYLEKPCRPAALYPMLREGLEKLTRAQAQEQLDKAVADRFAGLSDRESELMHLLIDGMTNREAAAAMGISVRTAEAHRARIMLKLDVDSFTDAIRMAFQCGFAQLQSA